MILQAQEQYNIQVKFYDSGSTFETIFATEQHFTSKTTDTAQEAVEIISNSPDKNTGARYTQNYLSIFIVTYIPML